MSFKRLARRYAGVLVVALAVGTLVASADARLSAGQSTAGLKEWNNAAGGSWNTAANWTPSGVPAAGDDVKITLNGTYTVTLEATVTPALNSLEVGGTSGTQTLEIMSSCTNHSLLSGGTVTIGGNGAVSLTSKTGSGCNIARLSGTISNAGTITANPGDGGSNREINGALTNTGTVNVNYPTNFIGGGTWTNTGDLNIADTRTLFLAGGHTFTNGAGGSVDTTGSGQLNLTGSTLNQGAGTTSGNPILQQYGTLNYTGSGASSITYRGNGGSLTGAIAAGQTLNIQTDCFDHAILNAAAGSSSAGTINFTSLTGSGCNIARLSPAGSGFTNTGTMNLNVGAGGADREITGNLTNSGTVNVNFPSNFNGGSAVWTNTGDLNIATGVTMELPSSQTFTNGSGGSVDATGTGRLTLSGSTLNQGAGTTSGNSILQQYGTLNYTGSGASSITYRGNGGTMTGNIAKDQTLRIQTDCTDHAILNRTTNLANAGTLELGAATGSACNFARLSMAGNTLTNTGTVRVTGDNGGTRELFGNLNNQKTLEIEAGRTLSMFSDYTQTNKGIFNTFINAACQFGRLSLNGAASLNGSLKVTRDKACNQSNGTTLNILNAASRSGTWSKVSGTTIKKEKYYLPTYIATGANLVVTSASLSLSPNNGPAGTAVQLDGANFPLNDQITITFKDKNGVVTTLASTTSSGTGTFSVIRNVPAGAALGAGKFTVKSKVPAVTVSKTFTVT